MLAYVSVLRFRLIWAALAAKCATECATNRIVCNGQLIPKIIVDLGVEVLYNGTKCDGSHRTLVRCRPHKGITRRGFGNDSSEPQ